jgi:hypothetical protein
MWQYNCRHNGVFGDNPLVGITPVSNSIPIKPSLYQNYPNPFNPSTKIKFDVPAGTFSNTIISIYDVLGKKAAEILNEKLTAGTYEIEWNASAYPSGVYFYKLVSGEYSVTKKMILTK